MTSKKYELTDITHPDFPHLRRTRALRDIPTAGVKAGDLGGWVESEHNLAQGGEAWVGGEAAVFGRAVVCNAALVRGEAWVSGKAIVSDNARVHGSARVYGNARVSGKALVYGEAVVCDRAIVSDNTQVYGSAVVGGNAQVQDEARVSGEAVVYDSALVYGNALVADNARVHGNAVVRSYEDIMYSMVIASGTYNATLYRTTDGHLLKVGCWDGTVPEFRAMIESDTWVEATPEQIELRRPELLAFASMCEARVAAWERSEENK